MQTLSVGDVINVSAGTANGVACAKSMVSASNEAGFFGGLIAGPLGAIVGFVGGGTYVAETDPSC